MLTMSRYLHATKSHIAFITETKCNTIKAKERISLLPFQNFEIIPSVGKSCGLWLMWSNDISLTILESSFYFFFARVDNVLGHGFWVVYMVTRTTL